MLCPCATDLKNKARLGCVRLAPLSASLTFRRRGPLAAAWFDPALSTLQNVCIGRTANGVVVS